MSDGLSGLGAGSVLRAIGLIREGKVIDLDTHAWHHMPVDPSHPPFHISTYRTPQGLRNGGFPAGWEDNDIQVAWLSDLVIGSMHSGTHLDALNHVVCGEDPHWHGGRRVAEALGDFGTLEDHAEDFPAIITRGVLIDVAGYLGTDVLPKSHPITAVELRGALEAQGVELGRNDAVLVRSGYSDVWLDDDREPLHHGCGLSLDGARMLADADVALVGVEDARGEVYPSTEPGNPLPVHVELLVRRGIPIMELVQLGGLASTRTYEFCFICLPLRLRGATASMVRPIAIT